MIRFGSRGVRAAMVASFRARRFSAVSGAVVLTAGSVLALTSCATGPVCSSSYQPLADAGDAAAAAATAATSPAGPRGPLPVDPGAPPTARPVSATLPSSATVTLVTGDRVRVDLGPGGPTATPELAPATGTAATGSSGFVRFAWGGDEYLVPVAAVPYVGSTLDLRLFDVSYLVRAGLDDAHAKALQLQVSGDAAALPELHPIGRGAGTESATLAKVQTPAVGRLLASAGRASSPSATLRRLGAVTLAQPQGAPALPTVPAAPATLPTASGQRQQWHTVTLKFIGSDGQSGTGIGWLQNLGDARLGSYLVQSGNPLDVAPPVHGATGPVSYSVPDGTYSIEVSVLTPHAGSVNGTDAALVVLPDVTVHGDQTLVLDARTATPFQSGVDPVVNAPVRVDEIDMWRSSASGGGCGGVAGGGQSMGLVSGVGAGFSASVISATPTATVKHGGLGFAAETLLHVGDGPNPSPDPRYFLVFPSEGSIPKSLRYTVPAADLTTVHSHVYGDSDRDCPGASPELWPNVYFPWGARQELQAAADDAPVDLSHVPLGDHTDYWYASDPKLVTFEGAMDHGDLVCPGDGVRYSARQTLHAGGQIDETWNKGPEVPASAAIPDFGASLGVPPFPNSQQDIVSVVAPATRQDDNGMLYLLRGGDSDASHFMNDTSTYSLSFSRDGQQLIDAPFVPSIDGAAVTPFRFDLPLAHRPATYQLDWATLVPLAGGRAPAPATDTVWAFHSSPSDPAATMPNGEQCAPDTTRSCAFLPLLFVHYDLPLDFQSQAPAGKPLAITFSVSGQQGSPTPKGVSATVSESFDGGKTWTDPVAATGTGNRFTATVDQPATSGPVYLKVHAADADGNAIDQTMTPAYGLTSGGE